MKQNDLTDVECLSYKIESLLKEYNCEITVDYEQDNKVLLVDQDTNKFEYLPFTNTGKDVL